MNNAEPSIPAEMSEQDIADFLLANPEFLAERPALLAQIELPHAGGNGTTSLVERQVAILRERNMGMRHRLDQLVETARRNDQLFEKTRKLTVSLLMAKSIDEMIAVIFKSFDEDFKIEQSQLFLFNEHTSSNDERLRFLSLEALEEQLPSLSTKYKIFCGQLTDKEKMTLFTGRVDQVQSAAVVPLLVDKKRLGILAIGNIDAQYYRSSMDTLVLSHIGDIFSHCLAQA